MAMAVGCMIMAFPAMTPSLQADDPEQDTSPVRLLFAGSSSTYWNDLPEAVAAAVSGKIHGFINRPAEAELVGRSGDDIRVYLNPGFNDYQYGVRPGQSFLDKIRDGDFDMVSLMAVCRFITREPDDAISHADAITRYCTAIRASGAEPVIYEMGWGTDEREARGRQMILDLARQNGVRFYAPCSTAWDRVRRNRPDIRLQHPNDSTHPGDLGHFLNLACFYATLTRTSPEGRLPRTIHVWPHYSREEKDRLKQQIDERHAAFTPSAYQSRLPAWMQRNAAALDPVTIPGEIADYLESIAWRTWTDVAAELTAFPDRIPEP